jgi:metal-responsive CopG/Arc/MetJ family transcriptional regulator
MNPLAPFPLVSSASGYLKRGLRQIGPALPVDLIVEFDRRVCERPFRSRTSMIAEALRHFLDCPDADWEAGDHPRSGDS